jgi:hypothetical protein
MPYPPLIVDGQCSDCLQRATEIVCEDLGRERRGSRCCGAIVTPEGPDDEEETAGRISDGY